MSIPKRYLSGLSPEEKKKRVAEIKKGRTTRTDDKSAYATSRFKTDEGKKTKPSKYTQRGKKLLAGSDAKTLDAKLAVLSKKTGYSVGTLKKVYNRGLAAWRTGHRPGASQHAWAMARVYSFVTGGKTTRTGDKDLVKESLVYVPNEERLREIAALRLGAKFAKKAFGAASFDTVTRGGKAIQVKRDLGGEGGGQFVSYKAAQAENFRKVVTLNRQVARMRGKSEPDFLFRPAYSVPMKRDTPEDRVVDQLVRASNPDRPSLFSPPQWQATYRGMDWTHAIPDIDPNTGKFRNGFIDEDGFNLDEDDVLRSRKKLLNADDEVKKTIRNYTMNGYLGINSTMAKMNAGNATSGEAIERVEGFRSAFEAIAEPAETDHAVFRGYKGSLSDALLGERAFRLKTADDLRGIIGKEFRTDTFLSTSSDAWVAGDKFGYEVPLFGATQPVNMIVRFHRKRGGKFAAVQDMSGFPEENEILLPDQEKYQIRGFTIAGASHPAWEYLGDEGEIDRMDDLLRQMGIDESHADIITVDDTLEIENPESLQDGGNRNIAPLFIIDVEQV